MVNGRIGGIGLGGRSVIFGGLAKGKWY